MAKIQTLTLRASNRVRHTRRRMPATVLAVAALIALGALSPMTAQVPQPSISVEPGSGPAGTGLSVRGFGFIEDTHVDIFLSGGGHDVILGRVPVNVDTGFATDALEIPEGTAPGAYSIVARGCVFRINGDAQCVPTNNVADAPFEVTAGPVPRYTPRKPVYDPTAPWPDWLSRTEAHVKFRQGSGVRLTNDLTQPYVIGSLFNPSQEDLDELDDINALLALHGVDASRLFAHRSVA
jgi:hypothetical protein